MTKDGKEIDRWISGETPHGIENPEDGRPIGGVYGCPGIIFIADCVGKEKRKNNLI